MTSHLVSAFSILGNIAAFMVYVAPMRTFIRIYREKSTGEYRPTPYIVGLFSFSMWLYYGFLGMNKAVITTNIIGCLMEIVYITIYTIYASRADRIFASKLLGFFATLALGVFAVTFFSIHGPWKIIAVEWICVISTLLAFGAPLTTAYQAYKSRSVEHMPLTLSCCLTFSGAVWCVYGLVAEDLLIAIPNAIGILLGVFQIGVYMMYR